MATQTGQILTFNCRLISIAGHPHIRRMLPSGNARTLRGMTGVQNGFGPCVWRITILPIPRHVTSRVLFYAMVALMLPDGITVTS
jgi:hypothetical protein